MDEKVKRTRRFWSRDQYENSGLREGREVVNGLKALSGRINHDEP